MAEDDFSALSEMVYSGRGITVGMTPSKLPFIGYSLTGRSPSSQARRLVRGLETGVIRTDVTDLEQLAKGNPALLLYPAIVPVNQKTLVASNGAQTKLLFSEALNYPSRTAFRLINDTLTTDSFFEFDAENDLWVDITNYEPDSPNNTPRISACIRGTEAAMHIVWNENDSRHKNIFRINNLIPGQGKLITTYSGGNENPLVHFKGNPLDVQIGSESARDIAESIYETIQGGQNPGDNYAVASAVTLIGSNGFEHAIINRSERGE